jgi:hypothetical protein
MLPVTGMVTVGNKTLSLQLSYNESPMDVRRSYYYKHGVSPSVGHSVLSVCQLIQKPACTVSFKAVGRWH